MIAKVGCLLVVGFAAIAPARVFAAACLGAGGERVTVTSVEPRLELRLGDGRLVRLAGLDPAQQTPDHPDLEDEARRRFSAMVSGKAVSLRILSAAPDRWGRLTAIAALGDGSTGAGDLAGLAIGAGLARYLPEPTAHACRADLLAAEARAREAKLGLWADPYYAVLRVDDQAAFAERSGTNVVALGRLTRVEAGPFRTKLRFEDQGSLQGSHGRRQLSAMVLPRVMKSFEAQGVNFQTLIGDTMRFRGLLDLRFGPQVELTGPDDVEIVDVVPAH